MKLSAPINKKLAESVSEADKSEAARLLEDERFINLVVDYFFATLDSRRLAN